MVQNGDGNRSDKYKHSSDIQAAIKDIMAQRATFRLVRERQMLMIQLVTYGRVKLEPGHVFIKEN